jgi:DNA polymerase-4
LRERVDQPSRTRYRLVGVGLGGLRDTDEHEAVQAGLFA